MGMPPYVGGTLSSMTDVLDDLYATLLERKGASADASYVASLYRDGLDKIL